MRRKFPTQRFSGEFSCLGLSSEKAKHRLAFYGRNHLAESSGSGWKGAAVLIVLTAVIAWPFTSTLPGGAEAISSPSVFFRALGLICGSLGLALYAVTLLLTTRHRIIESLFGGLPAAYRIHHILGTSSFLLLLSHPLLLALSYLVVSPYAGAMFLLAPDWPVTATGMSALFIMILFMVATFLLKLPYEIWRWTHILSGLGFLGGIIHAIYAMGRPEAPHVVAGAFLVGMGSYLYFEVWARLFKRRYNYRLTAIEYKTDSVIELQLEPESEIINFSPGQFVYVSFHEDPASAHRCGISRESHPFTISSAPSEHSLRFLVKTLGDYTSLLPLLNVGTPVKVEGPYGSAYRQLAMQTDLPQIWIAGGIGITPFLSYARTAKGSLMRAHLHCFLGSKCDNFAEDELREIEQDSNEFKVYFHYRDQQGLPSLMQIEQKSGQIQPTQIIAICGPSGLKEHLLVQMHQRGLKHNIILSEDFNLL